MEQQLLEKLRKVLAMTESPVEAEAQTAAAILARLLKEHNLQIADLEKRGAKHAPNVQEAPFDLGKAGFGWKLDLAETIAEHYFCYAIVSRYRKTVSFVGRPDNVESLSMLYGWVIDQIKRISAEERTRHKTETGEHIDPLRWQVNFGLGAVRRLGDQLRDLREKERADATCTALVVHHKSEISDWLEARGNSRIDGRMTKAEQESRERYAAQCKADAELKARDIEAYYDKYPWERPESDEDRTKREKREARNAARKTGRTRYRYVSAEDTEKEKQATSAHRAGHASAGRINLEPFIENGKEQAKKGHLK